ncbi:uncharacterized protein HMPREF1120_06532 [Exophiala dermatitidis NIH/UT8656]|uniref:Uncharacterized protein n=1 Tax=Exophiala dermatitidis (strain ATCC 34100 / CBS 525.76 / NIH/UT8656) TaxID=858893 RepID=H6C4U5_EXODN|nr:uncharacterized protein HMPREF1120_06532 [Exophiala dermatitidis NIH/UT8656]EHY58522.1 hypothetical protein HMPREF1120_06532 [Exophiala dermatitidis NIH/UT8656]
MDNVAKITDSVVVAQVVQVLGARRTSHDRNVILTLDIVHIVVVGPRRTGLGLNGNLTLDRVIYPNVIELLTGSVNQFDMLTLGIRDTPLDLTSFQKPCSDSLEHELEGRRATDPAFEPLLVLRKQLSSLFENLHHDLPADSLKAFIFCLLFKERLEAAFDGAAGFLGKLRSVFICQEPEVGGEQLSH